ncbi:MULTISPECIES: exodeoxyribonuclease VII large subunit [Actinomadura]|nr:exodeoxyribonuclease VII large subunit [Actinomadura hallensis]
MFCLAWDLTSETPPSWVVRVDGHIATLQPGPFGEWWDAHLVDAAAGAPPRTVTFFEKPQVPSLPLVQTIIGTYEDGRLHAAIQKRADPLFQETEFSKRWPIPDLEKPLMVLTASKGSAGWRDLGHLHEVATLDHRYAIRSEEAGTARRLIYFMGEAAKNPREWGGILITRGGGNHPAGQWPVRSWQAPLNDPDVLEAIANVQAQGLAVITGVGHERDVTKADRMADYAWPTPSRAGAALANLARYMEDARRAPAEGLPIALYNQGRMARRELDDAWARWHGHENLPWAWMDDPAA